MQTNSYMKYTAKEIVDRAFNIADLSNTDFISHKEQLQYLNDAWTTIYQYLINHNDAAFIKEVLLLHPNAGNGYTEYDLPFDLYQLRSVKGRFSGSLLPRHSESSSMYHPSYEVVNDKIRIYGTINEELLVTYWVIPLYLTFPDRTIPTSIQDEIISSAGDSVLLSDGTVYNVITEQILANFTLNPSKEYFLGNGHLVEVDNADVTVYSFKGTTIADEQFTGDVSIGFDSSYNRIIKVYDDEQYKIYDISLSQYKLSKYNHLIDYADGRSMCLIEPDQSSSYGYWAVIERSTDKVLFKVPISKDEHESNGTNEPFPAPRFDGYLSFYFNKSMYLIRNDNTIWIEDLYIPDPVVYLPIKYGYIASNGTDVTVYSGMPDTLLNFPKELYFQLIAADMAIRFLCKQNADSSGVQTLYEDMKATFESSLGQDADFMRIKNAY